jgi:thymidylate synthase ThyX
MTDEQLVDYIKRIAFKVSGMGHDSILEMGRYFITITLPRLAVEYLEHFRLNSYQERSLRLSRQIIFNEEHGDPGATRLAIKKYEAIQEAGFPVEDARYSLLMNTQTSVAINANYREFLYMTSRLLRSDHEVGKEVGQLLLGLVQKLGFNLEHCDDLVTMRGKDEKALFSPFGVMKPERMDYEENHKKPNVQIPQENSVFPCVEGHRDDEKTGYSITSVLSNAALAQLRRHRMSTLIIEKYHGNGISYEIDLEKGGFCYKSVEYGDPFNAPMGLLKAFTWVINERSMENFLRLRMDSHAQYEIREFATNLHRELYL